MMGRKRLLSYGGQKENAHKKTIKKRNKKYSSSKHRLLRTVVFLAKRLYSFRMRGHIVVQSFNSFY